MQEGHSKGNNPTHQGITTWKTDELSPWGRLGEEFNFDAQKAIQNGWVVYDEEKDEYRLTEKGFGQIREHRENSPVSSAYKEIMKDMSSGRKRGSRKKRGVQKKGNSDEWDFNYRGQLVRK